MALRDSSAEVLSASPQAETLPDVRQDVPLWGRGLGGSCLEAQLHAVMGWHQPRCNDQCEGMFRHAAWACLWLLQVVGLVLLAYADKFNLPIFFLRLLAYIYARPGREVRVENAQHSLCVQACSVISVSTTGTREYYPDIHSLRVLNERTRDFSRPRP